MQVISRVSLYDCEWFEEGGPLSTLPSSGQTGGRIVVLWVDISQAVKEFSNTEKIRRNH